MLWAEILTTVTLSAVLRLMALKQMNNPSVTLTMKIWLFIWPLVSMSLSTKALP